MDVMKDKSKILTWETETRRVFEDRVFTKQEARNFLDAFMRVKGRAERDLTPDEVEMLIEIFEAPLEHIHSDPVEGRFACAQGYGEFTGDSPFNVTCRDIRDHYQAKGFYSNLFGVPCFRDRMTVT